MLNQKLHAQEATAQTIMHGNQLLRDTVTEPQVWASVIQHLRLALSEYNIDVLNVLRDCGINPAELEHPHAKIPLIRYLKFLNNAEAEAQEPLLSLKLAKTLGVEFLGALGFMFISSRSLFDALSAMVHYQNVFQQSTYMSLTYEQGKYIFEYDLYGIGNVDTRCDVELSIAFTLQLIRKYTRNQVKAKYLTFRHAPSTAISKYQDSLATPCYFNQERNQIHLDVDHIYFQGSHHDASLIQILTDYLDSDLKEENKQLTFADQVRGAILKMQTSGATTADVIANTLGVSKSTLDRRLKAEATTFKQIDNEIKYDVSRKYLTGSQLSIYEISQMLGFSSAASFTRAFSTWSGGLTPSMLRK